jgi:hypothetical protein
VTSPERMRISLIHLAGVAVGLMLLMGTAAAAASQSGNEAAHKDYALIFGTVWNKDQRPAYGVPVKIRLAKEKKARWELMSNHSGEFAQRVPPGTADYVIWADVKMPKGKPKPETKIHIENNERVDVGLHLTE